MVSTRLAVAALAAAVASSASADLIAGWTMPCAFPTGAGNVPTGTSYLVPLAVNSDGTYNANPNTAGTTPWDPALAGRADQGANKLQAGYALSSVHQLASSGATPTSYTAPAGNGSSYAFSSNVWKAGDYYQAQFSTAGYDAITFGFDLTRSSTGPASVEVIMSTDGGTNWTTVVANYAVLVAGATGSGTTSWNATTYQSAFTSTLNLDSSAANNSNVIIRVRALVDAVNASNVFQAGGTMRIDNVLVNGNSLVPAPGAVALLGLAGLVGSRRRRG